jgi:hypothetical protein
MAFRNGPLRQGAETAPLLSYSVMDCYRVRQFLRALTARISEEELKQIACVLTPSALTLFRSMTTQDQRHGLDVYASLRRAGHTNPDLLTAALLHDVGKSAARLPPWQRAVIVLLERFAPRLLARLSYGKPEGWRRPFVVHTQHPEIGAQWAHEAGCTPLAATLIRRHEEMGKGDASDCQGREEELLTTLQAADNAN